MKKSFIEIIRCPLCKAKFNLAIECEENNDINAGKLICTGCNEEFPIKNGIPNLLPSELRQ
ncbi:MAG TPA: hypothetical protein DEP04_01870 [Dehalococcoidia bacterium]|nr:hypothetical protein [Dehalococcoidia bacterium]